MIRPLAAAAFAAALALSVPALCSAAPPAALELAPGDKVVLLGNALAERMQRANHFETLLHSRYPQHQLVVRNVGWSGDEPGLRPRSKDFADHGWTLKDQKPDALVLFFGFNESFAGPEGVADYKARLAKFIADAKANETSQGKPLKLALVSPIAAEQIEDAESGYLSSVRDFAPVNENLELYAAATKEVADGADAVFVDAFAPTAELYDRVADPLTSNGVHLNDAGYARLAPILDVGLFGPRPAETVFDERTTERLRAEIAEKNLQVW